MGLLNEKQANQMLQEIIEEASFTPEQHEKKKNYIDALQTRINELDMINIFHVSRDETQVQEYRDYLQGKLFELRNTGNYALIESYEKLLSDSKKIITDWGGRIIEHPLTPEQQTKKEVYMEVLADKIANVDVLIINDKVTDKDKAQEYRNYLRDCRETLRYEGNFEEIEKYKDIIFRAREEIVRMQHEGENHGKNNCEPNPL